MEAASTVYILLEESRFSGSFQVFNICFRAPNIKLSTRRLVSEEDSTFVRMNGRFGNYQAAQTLDKSLGELDISLLGTNHIPQQWWLCAEGMLGWEMQCQGSQPDPASCRGSSIMCWAPSAPTKSRAGMVPLHLTEVFQSHH